MSDFKLSSVNWQDGMLLTMAHLREQDQYMEELSRWYAAEANDNYGLVKKTHSEPSLKLNATLSGNRLRVEVRFCRAVMPGGMYVEFNEKVSGGDVLKTETEISETTIPVYLGVDPLRKKQVGEPDPAEEVPRIPNEIPGYLISLAAPPNLPEDRFLPIARLVVSGSEVAEDKNYIPPCVHVTDHERLAAVLIDFRNRMESLLKLSINAFTEASSDKKLEGASTKLQNEFRETTQFLAYHMAAHLDDFSIGRNSPHPSWVIVQFKKMFRVVSSLLNLRPGLKDYLNEKFFTKEAGTDIKTYLASVDAFLLSEYNHRDIHSQLQMVDKILGVLRAMMAFLAKTSLDQLSDQAVASDTLMYQGKTYTNVKLTANRLEVVGELSYLEMELAEGKPMKDAVTLLNRDLFPDPVWRNMQIRLGLNNARGLGETDPVEADVTAFNNKVVLHPMDMLQSSSVRQVILIFRGIPDPKKLDNLGKTDLILYSN
jgi:hypothetical protein